MEAARLLEKGYSEAEVARRVGVHRQSVNRWAKELTAGGRTALRKAAHVGRKPQLTTEDLLRIEVALKQGPEAMGYGTSLWTLGRG